MTQFDRATIQEHSEVFDEFVNLAIDKIDHTEISIVKVMTSYNYLKNALATIDKD